MKEIVSAAIVVLGWIVWQLGSIDKTSISLDSGENDDTRAINMSPVLRIERSGENVHVSPRDSSELLRRLHGEMAGESQRWYFDALEHGKMAIPSTFPAFENVVRATDGELWLADAEHVDASKRRWTVLTSGWEVPAFLELPADLEILSVGRAEVVGVIHGNPSDSVIVWPFADSHSRTPSPPGECR